jgi:hypothetical protein
MQDVIFVEPESTHIEQPIIIKTTCCASEDLQTLIDRIKASDTPCTRELVAILEDVHCNMIKEDDVYILPASMMPKTYNQEGI